MGKRIFFWFGRKNRYTKLKGDNQKKFLEKKENMEILLYMHLMKETSYSPNLIVSVFVA